MEYNGLHLGRVIRKVRNDKGINLEELAKGSCWTPSTISRFERENTTPYSQEKVQQLLERLGIMEEQIPFLVSEVKKEELIRNYMFRSTESQIKQNIIKGGKLKEKLDMINHPTAVKYLRGKQYFMQGEDKYDSAIKCYQSVIENQEDENYPESNIIPSAYLDLSVIYYDKSNYSKALEYLDQGIKIFNHQGSKQNVKYGLYYNKALFLEQLGRIVEADEALKPAWKDRDKIYDILTRIKVYQVKASILRQQNKLKEAYAVLSEAFDIANSNPLLADGQYYVLSELGKTTYELGRYEYSERCLLAALDFKEKLIKAKPTTTYITLGKIYLLSDRIDEAKEVAKIAIITANSKPKDIHKLIQAHILLGNIFEKETNKYEACLNYKNALQFANQYEFIQYKPELHDYLYSCNN